MHVFLSQALDYSLLQVLLFNENAFLGQVWVLMEHQIQRGFISLPKDVLCTQCSKGRFLGYKSCSG